MSLSKLLTTFHNKERKVMFCLMLAVMMMMTTGFTRNTIPANMHQVSILADGRTITMNTTHTSPEYILSRAGVKLSADDEFHLEKIDEKNTKITVYRAVPVTVSYNGQKKEVMTSKQTVGDALIELGYNLEDVEAALGLDTKIQENLDIAVKDSDVKMQALAKAQAEQWMPKVQTESGQAFYRDVYTMEATAYLPTDGNGAGITATGIAAVRGVVAVDPDVIPLGSRVYIPGYGTAIAADTGGAIRGGRIDLCMESYGEAINFGRRNVEVYILD